MGFWVLGFWGLGFRVLDLDLGFGVLGFRVLGFGFRLRDLNDIYGRGPGSQKASVRAVAISKFTVQGF